MVEGVAAFAIWANGSRSFPRALARLRANAPPHFLNASFSPLPFPLPRPLFFIFLHRFRGVALSSDTIEPNSFHLLLDYPFEDFFVISVTLEMTREL